MSRKSVLILGGSHSELPLIRAARLMGLHIYTSGNRPDHPGHSLADHYLPGDFSNTDEMLDLFKKTKCDFIVSAANDYAYFSACTVAELLGLPGYDPIDIAKTLHHKHLFKQLASSLGMPITRFTTLFKTEEFKNIKTLSYPIVIKPVDLTGGKGISKLTHLDDLENGISLARSLSKQEVLVIEEYFQGTLHSYSTIIQNCKVIFEYADNEYCHPNPYLVSTSNSIATVPLNILSDLRQQTEKLATHLKLTDGILHCQFLYANGDYVILEYTRRSSGDLYSDVVEAVTGVRHSEQFLRNSMSLPFDLSKSPNIGDLVSRHCVFPEAPGKFSGVSIDKLLSPFVFSITEALPRNHIFDTNLNEKAAVIIMRFPSLAIMLEHQNNFHSNIKCMVT
jgi:biotin carboxylase